jgi:hypothetical protein
MLWFAVLGLINVNPGPYPYGEYYLLGCDFMSGRSLSMFWRIVLPPLSGSKSKLLVACSANSPTLKMEVDKLLSD